MWQLEGVQYHRFLVLQLCMTAVTPSLTGCSSGLWLFCRLALRPRYKKASIAKPLQLCTARTKYAHLHIYLQYDGPADSFIKNEPKERRAIILSQNGKMHA